LAAGPIAERTTVHLPRDVHYGARSHLVTEFGKAPVARTNIGKLRPLGLSTPMHPLPRLSVRYQHNIVAELLLKRLEGVQLLSCQMACLNNFT
jgi:hypothetical protein